MIQYINGTLAVKESDQIVVETGGIGYLIFVPSNSRFYLIDIGQPVKIFTEMIVREDDVSLYGFEDMTGLYLFKKLITVNGVGAKAAMAIFSALTVEDIKKAIIFEDADMLTRANGIGKKTAQRIVLDLKDKFDEMPTSTNQPLNIYVESGAISLDVKSEAINALMELGYSRSEAAEAVGKVDGDDITVEDCIKQALRRF